MAQNVQNEEPYLTDWNRNRIAQPLSGIKEAHISYSFTVYVHTVVRILTYVRIVHIPVWVDSSLVLPA